MIKPKNHLHLKNTGPFWWTNKSDENRSLSWLANEFGLRRKDPKARQLGSGRERVGILSQPNKAI